ncbi:MAG: PKD domain-containing protein, partial [Bacteroidia bacterium]|nr:PKD domain-containing protein [Bacteroidia bacterium]
MNKKIFTLLIVIGFLWIGKSNAQCTADFGRNPRTACVGSPFVFYDLSTGGSNPKTWNWNFGPGATPATFNGQNPPNVTYSTTGTKTITLTYTTNGGGCTDVQQRDVDVVAQPTVTFTSNSPQCIGQQFNFTYTGSASLTYLWDFGVGANPSSSTIQNPQGITYSSAGTKNITLTINNGTCIQTSSQTITVSSTPTASFASTAPKCTGIAVDFINTGTSTGVNYSWDFGSGATPAISTSQNPTGVIYSTSGIKTVTLTVTNSTTGCAVTSTNTINIYQTPTSSFSSNAPVCENTAINFTNNSSTGIGVSYNWDFGVGATPATSTSQNPTNILYSSSGNKTVTLTVTNEFQCSAVST